MKAPTAGATDSGETGYGPRLERARVGLRRRDAGALLIGVGADLRYLTGHAAHPLERLTMLVLPIDGPASLVAPRLEAMAAGAGAAAAAGEVTVVPWDETDDAHALVARLLGDAGVTSSERLLVDPGLPALHLLGLQRALPGSTFGLATEVTRELRMVKSADEVERLRAAAHAADRVVEQIAKGRLVGRTESDVSREVRDRLITEGHDAASFAIVASGPSSASPHHEPGDRVIQPGEPIVLDIGGVRDGYCSDTTRTLWVTGSEPSHPPDAAFVEVFDLVREAQARAAAAVRPGVGCGALDGIAREVIRAAGYGDAFVHRLGHGIGLETHEEPYLVEGYDEILRPGHAFSIEPGIYLQRRFGVRIEDIVVCADDGPDVLNEAPRDLWLVPG